MSDIYQYKTDHSVIKLLQITDPHLFEYEQGELLGINTLSSFRQVIKEVKDSQAKFDLILATGDFVQDRSSKGYHQFVQEIEPLEMPVFWLPGNHDYQPSMVEVFSQYPARMRAEKHLLLGESWQVLLLDSQLYGVPHGELSAYQLEWLNTHLQRYPDRYALVVLHHHLVPTNSAWLDQHNLRNAYQLEHILKQHKQVKAILYGHIHQEVATTWNGYPVFATPSTCIQFKADCYHFTLDDKQPGWREIELHTDGNITTRVKRIQQASFAARENVTGY